MVSKWDWKGNTSEKTVNRMDCLASILVKLENTLGLRESTAGLRVSRSVKRESTEEKMESTLG